MSFNPLFSGGSAIPDGIFKIANSADNTKKAVFDLSAIAPGQTRTIVIPNFNIDLGALSTNSLHINGDNSPTANINWGGFKITNLGTPVLVSDSATKGYVDTTTAPISEPLSIHVNGSNSPTASINWGGFNITNLATPVLTTDAATKSYVDTVAAPISEPLSIHVNGSNSPTANINWGNFDLLNARDLIANRDLYFGPSGSGQYKLTQSFGGAQLIGQTSGQGGFLSLFSKNSTGADSATYVAYAKGLPDFSTAAEFYQIGWHGPEQRFVLETGFFNPGSIARALTIRTGQGSGVANTSQLVLNVDGSITHGGATGHQPYTFSRRTGALDRLTLQGQTTGLSSGLELFSKDGNATTGSYYRAWGVGTPASVTNSEHLFMGWDQSVNQYIISSNKSGTGTQRPLKIQAGIADQLLLNIDGSITNRNIKVSPNNANGVDWLQTVSGSTFYNFFGTPGTAANAVILGVYGLGTSGASANLEGVRLDYNGSSKYELHTMFAGTGIARPLELFTRNSGGVDNVGQIRLNTDGSVEFGGTLGTNPYKWLVNSSGVLNLQRMTAGQAGLDFYSQLGDGTQAVSSNIYAVGLPNAINNSELLRTMWTSTKFRLATVATGTGVVRPLSLETGTNVNQLVLNTDGSVTFESGPLSLAQQVTPSNPPALHNKLYFKADDNLYSKNSAGVEVQIGGGANTSLSNLSSVAINSSLLPAVDATIDIGSITNRFNNAWFASNVVFGGRLNGHRVAVADTDYAVLITDFIVAFTSLSASRNATLPAPTAALNGWVFIIKDESGTAGTNGIVLVGTVDGGSVSITANYGVARIYCNGTAYFTF